MPAYEYECPNGHHFERVLPVSEYDKPQTCECGAQGQKLISRTFGFVQRECRYDSPIDGRPITSWAQRRDDLARNGCQEYDPEMKKDAERFRAREQAKLEAAMDATVEEVIDKMPARKKESLERELSSGADISITRDSVGA